MAKWTKTQIIEADTTALLEEYDVALSEISVRAYKTRRGSVAVVQDQDQYTSWCGYYDVLRAEVHLRMRVGKGRNSGV